MLPAIVMMGVGVFSILGGAMNWDWYMNNRRARIVVAIVGRTGARIFYVGLGTVFFLAGVFFAVGSASL